MKLVEVVILTGLQCVSPTQNTSLSTEVSKVWCAVIVESDAEAKTIAVTPRSQVDHPMVKSVLTRIALAWTPPDKRVLLQSGLKVIDPAPKPVATSPQAAPAAQNMKSATLIAKTPAPLPATETPVPTASTDDAPDAVGDGASPEDTAAAIGEICAGNPDGGACDGKRTSGKEAREKEWQEALGRLPERHQGRVVHQ